jgi:hypothetical protein
VVNQDYLFILPIVEEHRRLNELLDILGYNIIFFKLTMSVLDCRVDRILIVDLHKFSSFSLQKVEQSSKIFIEQIRMMKYSKMSTYQCHHVL